MPATEKCKICTQEFEKTRSNRVCCSRKCASLLWYYEKGAEYFREHYRQNKEKKQKYQREYSKKRRDLVFSEYGGYRCSCSGCNETNPKFLTLDYINNDGAAHRKQCGAGTGTYNWIIKNHFPPIFQVLCYNCNCGKNVNGGVCPHKDEVQYAS